MRKIREEEGEEREGGRKREGKEMERQVVLSNSCNIIQDYQGVVVHFSSVVESATS